MTIPNSSDDEVVDMDKIEGEEIDDTDDVPPNPKDPPPIDDTVDDVTDPSTDEGQD